MTNSIIQFELPNYLACPKPTEARGIRRDEVRLLVTQDNESPVHTQFKNFAEFLEKGDVLVVNTSGTRPSAFEIDLPNGTKGRLHLSTQVNSNQWLLEIREVRNNRTVRWSEGKAGDTFVLPGGGIVELQEQYFEDREMLHLWLAELKLPLDIAKYMEHYARPIQYKKLDNSYPIAYYNTWFSFHYGSSEMPSAGRGFTQEVIDALIEKGVEIVPVLLHTGVSSLEENEAPYPEYMEVDPIAASKLNKAKKEGRRIIATGTTAVRAVESVIDEAGMIQPYKGHTSLYIKEHHEMKVVTGLLTGFHEPKASHLNMLQSLAGYDHIKEAYQVAIDERYYWHQFGDLHLILA